jgi:hypothetical protein
LRVSGKVVKKVEARLQKPQKSVMDPGGIRGGPEAVSISLLCVF